MVIELLSSESPLSLSVIGMHAAPHVSRLFHVTLVHGAKLLTISELNVLVADFCDASV